MRVKSIGSEPVLSNPYSRLQRGWIKIASAKSPTGGALSHHAGQHRSSLHCPVPVAGWIPNQTHWERRKMHMSWTTHNVFLKKQRHRVTGMMLLNYVTYQQVIQLHIWCVHACMHAYVLAHKPTSLRKGRSESSQHCHARIQHILHSHTGNKQGLATTKLLHCLIYMFVCVCVSVCACVCVYQKMSIYV